MPMSGNLWGLITNFYLEVNGLGATSMQWYQLSNTKYFFNQIIDNCFRNNCYHKINDGIYFQNEVILVMACLH